jgi:hypothetical protein
MFKIHVHFKPGKMTLVFCYMGAHFRDKLNQPLRVYG